MLQKLGKGNTILFPTLTGLRPVRAYSEGQQVDSPEKGYTTSVNGTCSTAEDHNLRRDSQSRNGSSPQAGHFAGADWKVMG